MLSWNGTRRHVIKEQDPEMQLTPAALPDLQEAAGSAIPDRSEYQNVLSCIPWTSRQKETEGGLMQHIL